MVVPSGCALRVFYTGSPQLLEKAEALAARVYEFSEFVVDVLGVSDLAPYLVSGKGTARRSPPSPHRVRGRL